jgi:mutator family transposase
MALDQSGLLEVLDALKAADAVTGSARPPKRLSGVVEAELTDTIGAALHERTESRINVRNGHRTRILSTTAGDRAPSSSASAARSRSRRRTTSTVPPAWVAPHPLAGLSDPRCGRGQQGWGPGAASPAPARATGRRWRWGCRCATSSW